MESVARQESSTDAGALSRSAFEAIGQRARIADFLASLRDAAFKRFSQEGPPSPSEELWRHTTPELFEVGEVGDRPMRRWELRTVDGAPAAIDGVELITEPAALSEHETLFESVLRAQPASLRDYERYDAFTDGYAQLQLASLGEVALLKVRRGTVVNEPLQLLLSGDTAGLSSSLLVVEVEQGASITLFEDLARDSAARLVMPRVEGVLRAGAALEFVSLQRLPKPTRLLARHRFMVERDARLHTFHAMCGAEVSRIDLDCCLLEPGAQAKLDSVYLADGSRHVDFHPTQLHLAPNCSSDLYSKGVIKEQARSVYYGYIRVAEGAQRTDAYQQNRNLILSSEARADSIPNLEIKANDVKCSHGSSSGQVNAEDIFYLMSRGLPRAEAERLLVEAFLEDVLARVSSSALHDRIQETLLHQLNRVHSRSSEE